MRKLEICNKCKYINISGASGLIRCAATEMKKSTVEEYGFNLPEEYEKLKAPNRCPYILEQIVT